jgi:8-oxo-dGTP diphosphatase
MIRCACLVELGQTKNELLVVRVRDNIKWYLPGGKIETGETNEQALIREIKEELNVDLIPSSIEFMTVVSDKAYGIDDDVELYCFRAKFTGQITPVAEISDVQYLDWKQNADLLAPAVLKLCRFFDTTTKI